MFEAARAERFVKLTLYKKGLFVIAGVLVIQLIFLGYYGILLNRSEFLAAQENHNLSVVGRCNWVGTLLSGSTLSCLAYAVTGDEECLDKYVSGRGQIADQFNGLANEYSGDSDQSLRIKHSKELITQLLAVLDSMAHQPALVPRNERLIQLVRLELLPTFTELYKLRHELLEGELRQLKQKPEELPKNRQERNEYIFVLIFINILIAAALMFIYTRKLTNRLAILSDNSRKFARRESLNEPVGGTDEIAQLDSTFHSMVDSLHLAEQRKQEFMSMISHDLRTPLTNVQASLEFVIEGHHGELAPGAKEWLNRAHDNVQTILGLIRELLEIERIESGNLNLEYSDIDVDDLLRRAVSAVIALAEKKKITIKRPKVDELLYLSADDDRLSRVLINLLGNALKFSPNNTTITIGVKELMEVIEFTVSDEGRGIPADHVARIFDRFQQVTADDARVLGGSGLGLAITKAIIEEHGGTIIVVSDVDKGTTFTFRIPKKKPQAVARKS